MSSEQKSHQQALQAAFEMLRQQLETTLNPRQQLSFLDAVSSEAFMEGFGYELEEEAEHKQAPQSPPSTYR